MPMGESGADTYDRITTFIDTMHRDFEKRDYPPCAIVTSHGLTSKVFLMRWFHWSVEEFDSLYTPKNCCIIAMKKVENDRYKLMTKLPREG
jgi:broad specificity phosphatase PhoE